MPRRGAFIIEEVGALARGLEYVTPATASRQLAAVRLLIDEVKPEGIYRWNAIQARITGFPAVQSGPSGDLVVVGAPLAHDLRELAVRLGVRAPESRSAAYTCAELAAQWRVSKRTLERWRKRGLRFCMVRPSATPGRGQLSVGVRKVDAQQFARSNERLIARAGKWSRLDEVTRKKALGLAGQLAQQGERGVVNISRQVATAIGRSTESVRTLLVATGHLPRSQFSPRRGATPQSMRSVQGMIMRGLGIGEVGRRMGLSKSAADRLVMSVRRKRLGGLLPRLLPDDVAVPATFPREDASSVLLAPPSVRSGLAPPGDIGRPHDWVETSSTIPIGEASQSEHCQRILACRYLLWRSREVARAHPLDRMGEPALDQIECDLRWCSALTRTLFISALPEIARRLQVAQRRRIAQIAPQVLADALIQAAHALCELVYRADAQQLASGRVRVDRALALSLGKPSSTPKGQGDATRYAVSASSRRFDPLESCFPWQRGMRILPARVARLPVGTAGLDLWQERLGWSGAAPVTMEQLAKSRRKPRWVIAGQMSKLLGAAKSRD